MIIFTFTFALLGIPDVIFFHANWADYLSVDLGQQPNGIFGMPWYLFLLFEHYPIIFGHGLYMLTLIAFLYFVIKVNRVRKKDFVKKYKNLLFLACSCLLFCASLVTLWFGAEGERMLVILPFISLFSGYVVARLVKMNKYIIIPLLCIVIAVQFFESFHFYGLNWVQIPA